MSGPKQGHLTNEVQSGDRARALVALRDQLASKIDAGPCKACGGPRGEMAGMASTIKELRAILDEIESLPDGAEVSFLDAARQQLNNRVSDAQDPDASNRSGPRKQGGRRPRTARRAGS